MKILALLALFAVQDALESQETGVQDPGETKVRSVAIPIKVEPIYSGAVVFLGDDSGAVVEVNVGTGLLRGLEGRARVWAGTQVHRKYSRKNRPLYDSRRPHSAGGMEDPAELVALPWRNNQVEILRCSPGDTFGVLTELVIRVANGKRHTIVLFDRFEVPKDFEIRSFEQGGDELFEGSITAEGFAKAVMRVFQPMIGGKSGFKLAPTSGFVEFVPDWEIEHEGPFAAYVPVHVCAWLLTERPDWGHDTSSLTPFLDRETFLGDIITSVDDPDAAQAVQNDMVWVYEIIAEQKILPPYDIRHWEYRTAREAGWRANTATNVDDGIERRNTPSDVSCPE